MGSLLPGEIAVSVTDGQGSAPEVPLTEHSPAILVPAVQLLSLFGEEMHPVFSYLQGGGDVTAYPPNEYALTGVPVAYRDRAEILVVDEGVLLQSAFVALDDLVAETGTYRPYRDPAGSAEGVTWYNALRSAYAQFSKDADAYGQCVASTKTQLEQGAWYTDYKAFGCD